MGLIQDLHARKAKSKKPVRYPPSRILNLIERLPEGSEFAVAYGELPREARDWSITEHLLAGVINSLQVLTIATLAGKTKKLPKVNPVQGPQAKKKQKRPQTIAELYGSFTGSPI